MTSKEQFEAWLECEQGLYGEDIEWQPERNCYTKFGIHLAWCAWQSSREEIVIDLSKMHLLLCDQNDVVCELNKHGLKYEV